MAKISTGTGPRARAPGPEGYQLWGELAFPGAPAPQTPRGGRAGPGMVGWDGNKARGAKRRGLGGSWSPPPPPAGRPILPKVIYVPGLVPPSSRSNWSSR